MLQIAFGSTISESFFTYRFSSFEFGKKFTFESAFFAREDRLYILLKTDLQSEDRLVKFFIKSHV